MQGLSHCKELFEKYPSVTQVGLELKMLLSQFPVCQFYMHATTLQAYLGCLAAHSTMFKHGFIDKLHGYLFTHAGACKGRTQGRKGRQAQVPGGEEKQPYL